MTCTRPRLPALFYRPGRAIFTFITYDREQVEFLKAQLASEQTLKAEVEAALGEEEPINSNIAGGQMHVHT